MRVLILVALLGAAFAAPQSQRIAGGEDTTIQQYPFFANINYGLLGIWGLHCGGSLISNSVVLTAADCVKGHFAFTFRVRLGSSTPGSGKNFNVEDFKTHERFDSPRQANDIALMFLSTRASPSNTIGFARIPGLSYTVADNTSVVAVGYGDLRENGDNPEMLQSVELFTVNQEYCSEQYAYLKTQPDREDTPIVSEDMLCVGLTGIGGKGFCKGDEGGPIVIEKDIVVGVASWRYRCGDPIYPGVATRVGSYADWIVANGGV
ncbi:hypothetical protein JYU34_006553 [Plutella xylostella]|uniref:Peptidase S1 domain-containing protein n=1 Tax=Plutella xylostella TaxID=51655 RepID=A0ABQ7QSC8_PLUXY|nr:hypothetical protein JYU34_006553 [Plutella xylostella]